MGSEFLPNIVESGVGAQEISQSPRVTLFTIPVRTLVMYALEMRSNRVAHSVDCDPLRSASTQSSTKNQLQRRLVESLSPQRQQQQR